MNDPGSLRPIHDRHALEENTVCVCGSFFFFVSPPPRGQRLPFIRVNAAKRKTRENDFPGFSGVEANSMGYLGTLPIE
jgi:hypothetical protein